MVVFVFVQNLKMECKCRVSGSIKGDSYDLFYGLKLKVKYGFTERQRHITFEDLTHEKLIEYSRYQSCIRPGTSTEFFNTFTFESHLSSVGRAAVS